MKTNQILTSRELCGIVVRQRTIDGYFNLSDLLTIGNKYRINEGLPIIVNVHTYLRNKNVKIFIDKLEEKIGKPAFVLGKKGRKTDKDLDKYTWGHPLLMIDFALWLNPELKIEVYDWVIDLLVKYRCDSSDSYRKMCGALLEISGDKRRFVNEIPKIAKKIKKECEAIQGWNASTQKQLELRNRFHENIAGLCGVLKNTDQAVRIGIELTKKQLVNN